MIIICECSSERQFVSHWIGEAAMGKVQGPKFQRMSIERITIDPEDSLAESSITKIQCTTIDQSSIVGMKT